MIYLSKRDTALMASDAAAILAMSAGEYRLAVSEGRLRRSVRLHNDPTGRLAFHSFWDLLEFSLAGSPALAPEGEEARPSLVEELCDHIALSDEDVAAGTGDADADRALLESGWSDESGLRDLPASVVEHYAGLVLRTLGQLHAVVGLMARRRGAPGGAGEAWMEPMGLAA